MTISVQLALRGEMEWICLDTRCNLTTAENHFALHHRPHIEVLHFREALEIGGMFGGIRILEYVLLDLFVRAMKRDGRVVLRRSTAVVYLVPEVEGKDLFWYEHDGAGRKEDGCVSKYRHCS